jgi:hypothetical protein
MFALDAFPETSPVAPTATVAATPAPQEQAACMERSLVAMNRLRFHRDEPCIFKALRTLLRAHFPTCYLFSVPCALFRALFFELVLCFQWVARSLVRSFASVQMLTPALLFGCALFRKNTREGVGVPALENSAKRVLDSDPVAIPLSIRLKIK